MLNRQQKAVLPHLCQLIGPTTRDEPPDRELLERFLGQCDEAAFAALVRRHGPMVLHVCRRRAGRRTPGPEVLLRRRPQAEGQYRDRGRQAGRP